LINGAAKINSLILNETVAPPTKEKEEEKTLHLKNIFLSHVVRVKKKNKTRK